MQPARRAAAVAPLLVPQRDGAPKAGWPGQPRRRPLEWGGCHLGRRLGRLGRRLDYRRPPRCTFYSRGVGVVHRGRVRRAGAGAARAAATKGRRVRGGPGCPRQGARRLRRLLLVGGRRLASEGHGKVRGVRRLGARSDALQDADRSRRQARLARGRRQQRQRRHWRWRRRRRRRWRGKRRRRRRGQARGRARADCLRPCRDHSHQHARAKGGDGAGRRRRRRRGLGCDAGAAGAGPAMGGAAAVAAAAACSHGAEARTHRAEL